MPPPSPSPPLNVEDMPVRASVLPPFGVLAPHAGMEAALVRGCWLRLGALFKSRVKTLPNPDLVRMYEGKVAFWTGVP